MYIKNHHCSIIQTVIPHMHGFDYICYSKAKDGLYCMWCVLFPDSSHRRPKKLISEPFQNWKDALEDLKNHASCEYHCNSMAKMWAFLGTYENYASRIDLAIAETSSRTFQQNREVLRSVLKSLVFCGRQGIALRGHKEAPALIKVTSKHCLLFELMLVTKFLSTI